MILGARERAMRTLIALVFSCASVLGADIGIHVVTTIKTNKLGGVSTKDVFTRDGQTNLVRIMGTESGVVQMRLQKFYFNGLLVGDFVTMPESSGFSTCEGSPYAVTFEFGRSNEVKSAVFGTNGVVLDAFMATNGVFYPADISLIRKANEIGGDVHKLMSPAHVTKIVPGQFRREVEQLIEKHKNE